MKRPNRLGPPHLRRLVFNNKDKTKTGKRRVVSLNLTRRNFTRGSTLRIFGLNFSNINRLLFRLNPRRTVRELLGFSTHARPRSASGHRRRNGHCISRNSRLTGTVNRPQINVLRGFSLLNRGIGLTNK